MASQAKSPATPPSVLRRKRASPWRITRYSPYLSRNPLVSGPAQTLQSPNPLYQGQASQPESLPEQIIHITMPFSLRQNGIPCNPSQEQAIAIAEKFPTCKEISYQHPFLVVVVRELPPKPWPVFLAGLPLAITTTEIPLGLGGMPRHFPAELQSVTVPGIIERYKTPSENTMLQVYHLLNERGAGIDEIQWDGCWLYAVGSQKPQEGWEERLPARVNDLPVTYIWGRKDMDEHAQRKKLPTQTEIDDSNYIGDLRPGVVLTGLHNNMESIIGTTSGVYVRSPISGKNFITVAAHGFTAGVGDYIYHPKVSVTDGNPDDRNQIARIERLFGDTDIALAELKPGMTYSRTTFSELDSPMQPFRRFKDLRPENAMRPGDYVYMNTPFNGVCEGSLMRVSWCFQRATEKHPKQQETRTLISLFTYWGNGSNLFLEGCCGGVIWDKNLDVLGQFRYQDKDGQMLAYAPTFTPLIENGYQLSSV
jgi:hypothetical protein